MKNKKTLLIIVVIVLLIGGGFAWALTKKDNNKSETNNTSSSTNNASDQTSGDNFDAAPTSNLSFVATITTNTGDKTSTGVMSYDHTTGNVKYVVSTSGQEITTVYTKDAYYLCQTANNCIKYALGQNQSNAFDPDSYKYDTSKIGELKNGSTFIGTQACPVGGGDCKVWQVTSNGFTSKVFVNTSTKRIVQVEGSGAGASSKIVYEYKDVSVTAPANAKTLPNVSQ